MEMHIIDFERKGQQVKFYLGDYKLSNYYGDDRPYKHNAGKV
jgi:rRNA maturation protein Rpf1